MINGYKILNGAKYYSSGIFQSYLIFISDEEYIKYSSGTTRIYLRKSNRISEKYIENLTKSNSSFAPTFVNHHLLLDINFDVHCLINNNIYIAEKLMNLYISYVLNPWLINLYTDFTFNNCLFESN